MVKSWLLGKSLEITTINGRLRLLEFLSARTLDPKVGNFRGGEVLFPCFSSSIWGGVEISFPRQESNVKKKRYWGKGLVVIQFVYCSPMWFSAVLPSSARWCMWPCCSVKHQKIPEIQVFLKSLVFVLLFVEKQTIVCDVWKVSP